MQLKTTIVIEHGRDGRTDRNVTGNVAKVFDGDAVEQAERLAALQLVFGSEFDRGEMTVGALQLELWQAHWYRASRLAMQRAADMLVLATASGIPANGKLARECEGLAKVLDLFVNAKPKDHPIGDALLRGEPIPASDGKRRLELEASSLRADGMHPTALLTSEESQALAEQIRSTADAVETVGAELDEKAAQAAEGAGSTVGADDSPFRLYQFAHEMHELLKRINVAVGGLREIQSRNMTPTPIMLCECDQAIWDIWPLLARIQGLDASEIDTEGREARVSMINAADDYQAVLNCAAQQETLRQKIEQAMTCEILEADFSSSVITLQVRQRLEGIGVGLWKLVPYQRNSDGLAGAA